MRAVVTGGAGAIGSAVVAALARSGASVVSVDRVHGANARAGDVRDVVADVTDAVAIRRIVVESDAEVVIHLAASLPAHANDDLAAAMEVNVRGAQHVVEACIAGGVQALVHLSSKAVYGRPRPPYAAPEHRPVPESAPRHPVDGYGISKLAGEATVRALAEAAGLPVAILRLSSTFGPGKGVQHGSLSWLREVVEVAVSGGTIAVAHSDGSVTDLIYDRDVARGVLAAVRYLLAATSGSGAVEEFNIGSGRPVPVASVLDALERAAARRVFDRGARHEPRVEVPETGIILDTSRAERHLGLAPSFTLDEALEDFMRRVVVRRGDGRQR